MKIKLRKQHILACICALQLGACALVKEDTRAPIELLSPSVMAMIQQDAQDKVRKTQSEEGGEATPINPNAISIETLLRNALKNSGKAVSEQPKEQEDQVGKSSVPKPTRKPIVKVG